MLTQPIVGGVTVQTIVTDELKALFDQKMRGVKTTPIKAEVRTVKITDIHHDQSYKKKPNPDEIFDFAAKWNDNLYSPILVAERSSGELYVIRGLTCILAAYLRGKATIDVMVIKSKGASYEANLFNNLCSQKIRAPHKHKNVLENKKHPKYKEALLLQQVCDAAQVVISENQAAGVLTGTERISQAISLYGDEVVIRALKLYRRMWPNERVHAYLVSGMAAWIHVYQDIPHFTDQKIIDYLSPMYEDHHMIIRDERARNTNRRRSDPSYAELLAYSYNQKTRGRGRLNVSSVKAVLEG